MSDYSIYMQHTTQEVNSKIVIFKTKSKCGQHNRLGMFTPKISVLFLVVWIATIANTADLETSHEAVEEFVQLKTGFGVLAVQDSAIGDFYTAVLEDSTILYVSKDLKFFIRGDLYEAERTDDEGLINHTENMRQELNVALLEALDPDSMITFPPLFEDTKASVYVFTDTTCGYCRKLHAELNDYHEHGIQVNYLAYPRAGVGSDAYNDMVSAWCAAKPQMALTDLKLGDSIDEASCDNPVEAQIALGRQFGLRGTPLIVLSNGKKIGGYVPAEELAEILESEGLMQ